MRGLLDTLTSLRRLVDPALWLEPRRLNLLDRVVLVEAVVTVDLHGYTRCAVTRFDEDVPIELIIKGFVAVSQHMLMEAERLAAQHGMAVSVSPEGNITLG